MLTHSGSSGDQGSMPIYSEPIYSYPASPPMRGASSIAALSSPMNFHRPLAPFEPRENQTSMKEEAHKMNIYGTLPRAQIRRRQPLQRIDSENSETDDASKTLHLTKATTFFNDKDDQDFYGVNNLDLNQNIQSLESSEQIINARNLGNYATFRYHRATGGLPQPSYFQPYPSLLCGPMVPLHVGSPLHHPSLLTQQQQSTPMSQWSRDDLHLILSSEREGGLNGSSGKIGLESKNQFKSQIRKLENRQQKISRSFEQLVELTEPDDDTEEEDGKKSLPSLVPLPKANNSNSNFSSNANDNMHEALSVNSGLQHEYNVDDLMNSSVRCSSSDIDSSANDTR